MFVNRLCRGGAFTLIRALRLNSLNRPHSNLVSFNKSSVVRCVHTGGRNPRRITSTLYYLAAVGVLVVGGSYAAVPLYRIFCQVSLLTVANFKTTTNLLYFSLTAMAARRGRMITRKTFPS